MLSAGARLGPYEVVSPLGAGGMGEVYRARDTKLGRDVALKVLPEAFTADADRLARFEREAKVLASLNHPHIGQIYGLEEADGQKALVLELVEGPTLANRIAQGPLPLDEALPIARQIAEALEAAHEQGIIHRDLKPANVKVRPDGTVKVLDFGLARAYTGDDGSPGSSSDLSQSPTLAHSGTGAGVILGTAAYMSPEQARGRPVDRRADIWAFGCLLYQMLTGKQPFCGDTFSDTLARVIEREPDWTALPGGLPPVLEAFLRRCLDKNARQRLRDAADLRLALEGAFDAGGPGAEPPGAATRHALLPWSVAAIAAAGLAVLAWSSFTAGPPLAQPVRFAVDLSEGTSPRSHSGSLALSPDGSRLVFSVGRGPASRLYVRPLGELDARPIPGTEGGIIPFFSPDGASLGFWSNHQLKRVPSDGGVPVTMVEEAAFQGASWGDRGSIVYARAFLSPLWVVDGAGGGQPRALTDLEPGELGHWWPQFLPGEAAVIFTNYATRPSIDIYLPSSGERRTLVEDGAFGRYVRTGHLLFNRGSALVAAPFDLHRLELVGLPVPVVDEVALQNEEAGSQYSVSESGTLVYLPTSSVNPPMVLALVDRRGVETPLFEPDLYETPRVAPDGRQIAVQIRDSDLDIWRLDLDRGTRSKLTQEAGSEFAPVWAPGGGTVFFTFEGAGNSFAVARRASDGSGALEALAGLSPERADIVSSSLTPDGNVLAYSLVGEGGSFDIWTSRLDTSGGAVPFLATPHHEGVPAFSPDGRWIAYQSDESGRFEIYVLPYPNTGPRATVSTQGGAEPVWSPDGRELFYRPLDERGVMSARVTLDGSRLSFAPPERLFETRYERHPWVTPMTRNYDVMPDGRHFVMIRPAGLSAPRAHVVVNWFAELERLVPGD